jgi:DNA-binding MarR family transcriptional regulator
VTCHQNPLVTVTSNDQVELRRRIGRAWREIRRGASASRIRDLFYARGGEDSLDLALADTLSVLCTQGPMRMGELAEALHITPASTTRAVTCLAEKGYATRVRATDDQRSVEVSATAAGMDRFAIFQRNIQSGLSMILAEFSPEEQELLADFLERFVDSIDRFVDLEDH